MRASWGFVVTAVGLVGCRSATQIEVKVDTDVPCSQVSRTAVTSGTLGEIERIPPATTTGSCVSEYIGSVVLVPSGAEDALVGFKVVTAINGESVDLCVPDDAGSYGPNCIVARRALRYLPHTPLLVDVLMSGACAGKACDPNSTCVEGACVLATIPDPTTCADLNGCGEGVLGADGGVDAAVDATIGEGGSDAPSGDATSGDGSGSDANGGLDGAGPPSDAQVTPTDAGYAGPVPGCDLSGALAGAIWPMEDYCPTHRNRSAYVGPVAPPRFKWSASLPGQFLDQPSVGPDGTVYASGSGLVEALRPDGTVAWSYTRDVDGGLFQTTPLLAADGTVRVLDVSQGTFAALSVDGGAVVFSQVLSYQGNRGLDVRGGMALAGNGTSYVSDVNGDLLGVASRGGVSLLVSSASDDYVIPTIALDGTVFTTTDKSVFAFSPDGGARWSDLTAATGDMSSVAVALDGTLRVASPADGFVYAYGGDGGALWSATIPIQENAQNSFALADDGTAYLSTENGMTALDPDGGLVATYNSEPCAQPVIDAAGFLYAVCGVLLVRFDSGLNVKWSVTLPLQTGQLANDSPVLAPGGTIYLAFDTQPPTAGLPDVVMAYGP